MRWTAGAAQGEIPGMYVKQFSDGKEEIESLQERITGRFSCEDIKTADGRSYRKGKPHDHTEACGTYHEGRRGRER